MKLYRLAILLLSVTVLGEISLNRLSNVGTCTPISIDWVNGNSDAPLSIDLYRSHENQLERYSEVIRAYDAKANRYLWTPSRRTIRDLRGKIFVLKFTQDGERGVYSNQFSFERCRSNNDHKNHAAVIAGGILGALTGLAILFIVLMIVLRRRQAIESRRIDKDVELRALTRPSSSCVPSIPSAVHYNRSAATSFNSTTAPPPYSMIYEDFDDDARMVPKQPAKIRRKPVPSV